MDGWMASWVSHASRSTAPSKQSVDRSINQSINQSINPGPESIDRSTTAIEAVHANLPHTCNGNRSGVRLRILHASSISWRIMHATCGVAAQPASWLIWRTLRDCLWC